MLYLSERKLLIPGLQYDWSKGMSDGEMDVIIGSGAFISGFMFEGLLSFKEGGDCGDSDICVIYGSSLILTTLIWFVITFMAIYIRIYSHKFLLVQYVLRITQIISMVLTLFTINMVAWYRNNKLLGQVGGKVVGTTVSVVSIGYFVLFFYDFYHLKGKKLKTEIDTILP